MPYGYGHEGAWFGAMWGIPFMGLLIMLAVFAVVVWGIYTLVRAVGGRRGPEALPRAAPRDPALDALRERYARGEIDRETFERMRRDLET